MVFGCTRYTTPATATNGGTVNLAQVRLSRVRVIGNNGLVIPTGYIMKWTTSIAQSTNVTFEGGDF